MKWNELLSQKRKRSNLVRGKYAKADLRSEFEKDYHRIIGSASFRRLQDKTQVFPLDKSDFIRTRLTHSLEVSSIGKSLAQNISEYILNNGKDTSFTVEMKEDICDILLCAGLIHDIGNPPFGHFGEEAIREWFRNNLSTILWRGKPIAEVLKPQMLADLYQFEGNAQALRLVTKLHFLVDEYGMNLTYGLLNTIIKYPVSSIEVVPKGKDIKTKKMGYYYADEKIFKEIQRETKTGGNRHPLTYILEAADDIAYKTADIEDAFVKGFISYSDLKDELEELETRYADRGFNALEKLESLYQLGKERHVASPEEYAVKNWIVRVQGLLISCATFGFTTHYDEIMTGTYNFDLFHQTAGEQLMNLLGDMAFRRVFTSQAIYKMELSESVMINYLLDRFVKAVVNYDDKTQKISAIDTRLLSFISDNYKRAYHFHAEGKDDIEKLYLRLLLVTDYICGMTDSYAKRFYQELKSMF